MTRGRCTGLLWLALVVCAPLPFFLVERGREPVAASAVMLASLLALVGAEGSGGAIGLAAAILAAQVLLGGAVLGLAAAVVVRLLERLAGARRDAALAALILALLVVAMTQPIYLTPFRPAGLHATLAEVFE